VAFAALGLPFDASHDGWRIDWLIDITLVFIAVLFAIMVAWMLWACIRHNHKHRAVYSRGDSRRSIALTLGVAGLIFFTVDGNLFVNSTLDLSKAFWNFEKAESDPRAVRIEVNAHQWAWDVRYPGPDGRFNTRDDIVLLNRMVVPVDRPVIVQLAATDVVHSFSLPNFRVKADCVPGTINRVWFRPKEIGEYGINCAQHCGLSHYLMKGILRVVSDAEYEAWAREQSELAAIAYDPSDARAHWGWEWRRR